MFKKFSFIVFFLVLFGLILDANSSVFCVKITESNNLESLKKLKSFVVRTGISEDKIIIFGKKPKYELYVGYENSFGSIVSIYKKIRNYFYTAYITTCNVQKSNTWENKSCQYFDISNPPKINLSYMYSYQSLLDLYKKQIEFFEKLLNNSEKSELVFTKYKINPVRLEKKIINLTNTAFNKKFDILGYIAYNSNNFIPDDISYPFNWITFIGIEIPFFKGGWTENSLQKKYYTYLEKLYDLKIYISPENILKSYSKYNQIINNNLVAINTNQYNFIKNLKHSIKKLLYIDKYYYNLLKLLDISYNLYNKDKISKKLASNIRFLSICKVDTEKIHKFLNSKRDEFLKKVNNLNLDIVDNEYLFKLRNIDVRGRITFNYRNSPSRNDNDYLRGELLIRVPFPNQSERLTKIERLKFMNEKLKIIDDFNSYIYLTQSEIINLKQNYTIYKEHEMNYKNKLLKLKNEYMLVRLNIKSLDVESFTESINYLYKELKLLFIYQSKILISLNKIYIFLKSVDNNFKLECK